MSKLNLVLVLLFISAISFAQPPSPSVIRGRLSKGTIIHGNVPYNQ